MVIKLVTFFKFKWTHFFKFIFNWSLISLQYFIGFFHTSHELAIGIHMSPPSWTSVPPPTPSYPSRLSQSTHLSSLSHTADFHWLSVLHMVVYMFGESNGTPLQYSCLENPMDGGAWWAAVYGVAQSRTRLMWLSSSSSSVYVSKLLTPFIPPSPPCHHVHKSVIYVCICTIVL